jgi:hypothetical protein
MNFAVGALNTERIGFVHELNDYRQEALWACEDSNEGDTTTTAR